MFDILLTKSNNFILGPVSAVLGEILNLLYNFLGNFGIVNIGITIILFNFVVKSLMIPLTLKQQKFSKLSSKMNPELTKITSKYKNKKDDVSLRKQQEETQAVYAKYGASPTAGCLPLLIQFPIMIALYQIIYKIPAYVDSIKNTYLNIVNEIIKVNGYSTVLEEFATEKRINVDKLNLIGENFNSDHIIDIISKFASSDWSILIEKLNNLQNIPDLQNVINSNVEVINRTNMFFGGINIADAPGFLFPGIIIPILAGLTQYISTKMISTNNTMDATNPMAQSLKTMNVIMPFMSAFFCLTLPAGIGLYWISSSVFTIVQQFFVNKHLDKIDMEQLIEKNVEKRKKKLEKMGIDPNKPLPKPDYTDRLSKNRPNATVNQSTKSISEKAKMSTKKDDDYINNQNSNTDDSKNIDNGNDSNNGKPGSVAYYANLLKNKNYDKGDK